MSDRSRASHEAIERAQRLVARARRRLLVAASVDGLFTGLLLGALPAILIGGAGLLGWGPAPGPWLLLFPGIGALFGVVVGIGLAPDDAHAALVLDRVAHTGEALVSALTATDAKPAMRALAAEGGLASVGDRPLKTLLPWSAPRTAIAAVVAVAAAAAMAFLPGASDAGGPTGRAPTETVPAAGVPGTPAPGGAGPATRPVDSTGLTGPNSRPTAAAPSLAPLPEDPATLETEADLRGLAEDLAARGSEAAEKALAALATGDREAAVEALREALGVGSALVAPAGSGRGTASIHGAGVAGAWSSSRWPLRYDRAVRRYMTAQAAATADAAGDGDDGAPSEKENR